MVLGLAENLEVPLRERNQMLLAAGFAPEYRELAYEDPALAPVRTAVEEVLAAHDPYPALVVDRHWELIAANAGVGRIFEGIAPDLLEPPINALRASLIPRVGAAGPQPSRVPRRHPRPARSRPAQHR